MIVIHYHDSNLDAVFSESVRTINTSAVAKHCDFHRDSICSTKGALSWETLLRVPRFVRALGCALGDFPVWGSLAGCSQTCVSGTSRNPMQPSVSNRQSRTLSFPKDLLHLGCLFFPYFFWKLTNKRNLVNFRGWGGGPKLGANIPIATLQLQLRLLQNNSRNGIVRN